MILDRDVIDPTSGLELRWRLYDRGLTVRLGLGAEPLLFVTLWLARRARVGIVQGNGAILEGAWHLDPGRYLPRDGPDPFACLIDHSGDRQGLLPAAARMRLRRRVAWLADQAARRCDPAARDLALRFHPGVRFAIYGLLMGDATGRLRQLATTCPGALILASARMRREPGEAVSAGERLLERVQGGVRLDRVLDAACREQVTVQRDDAEGADVPDPAEVDRLRRAWRILLRRAGPRVPPDVLRRAPPLGLVPDDIPTAPRANARWFRVMLGLELLQDRYRWDGHPALLALSRLVSGQVDALVTAPPRRLHPRTKLMLLCDHLVARPLAPARSRGVAALLAEAIAWHEALHRPPLEGIEDWTGATYQPAEDLPPYRPLPLPEVLPEAGPDLVVRPLETVGALIAEGRRMHHCVATRASDALAGRCHLFSAEVEGQPLTVEVTVRGRDLRVGDVSGPCNRPPTREEWAVLEPWLKALGVREAAFPW